MTDAEKIGLCKANISSALDYGPDSADAANDTLNDVLVVLDYEGGGENG